MLRHLLSVGFVASVAAFCAASSGCTSLLGDFEVSSETTSSPEGGTTADGAPCTMCGESCVDLQTSADHCGRCDNKCGAAENCQAGACTTSWPAPELLTKPLTPTGWRDGANAPIVFEMKPTGIENTIYECRSGPEAKATPPAWGPCDGKEGKEPKHFPQSDQEIPEGTYRFEYRYKVGEHTSPILGYRFYTLFKLDKLATCPRPGFPDDGPRYSDAEYFAAAVKWSQDNPGQFPLQGQFPEATNERQTSPMWLENPFIKVTFQDIEESTGLKRRGLRPNPAWEWPEKGGTYLLNERSLRHIWQTDPERRLLAYKRQYVRPNIAPNDPKACANELEIGHPWAKRRGPVPRGPRRIDCEAWVFNAKGQALCMGTRSGTTTPVVLPIDRQPVPLDPPGGARVHTSTQANYTVLYSNNAATNDLLALFDGNQQPLDAYIYVESPQELYRSWYKVNFAQPSYVQIEEVPWRLAGEKGVSGCTQGAGGCSFKYAKAFSSRFVVPTGFVKLHNRLDHAYAMGLRAPGLPAWSQKCETPGCDKLPFKDYLTFLPP